MSTDEFRGGFAYKNKQIGEEKKSAQFALDNLKSNMQLLDNKIKQSPRNMDLLTIYNNSQKVLKNGDSNAITVMNTIIDMGIGKKERGAYTLQELAGASARIAGTQEKQENISLHDFRELGKSILEYNKFKEWVERNPNFTEPEKQKVLEEAERKFRETLEKKDSSILFAYMKSVMPVADFNSLTNDVSKTLNELATNIVVQPMQVEDSIRGGVEQFRVAQEGAEKQLETEEGSGAEKEKKESGKEGAKETEEEEKRKKQDEEARN